MLNKIRVNSIIEHHFKDICSLKHNYKQLVETYGLFELYVNYLYHKNNDLYKNALKYSKFIKQVQPKILEKKTFHNIYVSNVDAFEDLYDQLIYIIHLQPNCIRRENALHNPLFSSTANVNRNAKSLKDENIGLTRALQFIFLYLFTHQLS